MQKQMVSLLAGTAAKGEVIYSNNNNKKKTWKEWILNDMK